MAILCGAEGNKFLFANERKLVRVWWPRFVGQIFSGSFEKSSADESIKLRRMISLFLKGDCIPTKALVMDSVMKRQMQTDCWRSDTVQISSMAKKYVTELSCEIILGVNDLKFMDEFSKQIEVIDIALNSAPVNLPGTSLNRGIKASKVIRKEIEKIVKQRKIDIVEKGQGNLSTSQDMVSIMLLNSDENGEFISDSDIASYLLGMLEASFANLHHTITLVMVYLSELPHVYDKVLREQMEIARLKEPNDLLSWEDLRKMKYTWNVACEALRLSPPLGTFREAITDFEYNGYLIPKGWKMNMISRVTQRNPEYYPEPEKFDPTRFEGKGPAPYTFVPFGGGPRMCPGIEYSRSGILIFIHNVVTKFKWEKVIPDEKLILGGISSPANGLPIHLHPVKS